MNSINEYTNIICLFIGLLFVCLFILPIHFVAFYKKKNGMHVYCHSTRASIVAGQPLGQEWSVAIKQMCGGQKLRVMRRWVQTVLIPNHLEGQGRILTYTKSSALYTRVHLMANSLAKLASILQKILRRQTHFYHGYFSDEIAYLWWHLTLTLKVIWVKKMSK